MYSHAKMLRFGFSCVNYAFAFGSLYLATFFAHLLPVYYCLIEKALSAGGER